tara:strand:+ start:71 stop:2350 length:2280 start_codon:yes stop_codon:yes gene_type:complete
MPIQLQKYLLASACLGLLIPSTGFAAISIDGVLDEPEWADAEVYGDFVTVEPLTGAPAKYATEVRMITSEDGIFVGFKNYQPASVKRVHRRFARDAQIDADRNVVGIDFDGTALAGYDFTVGSVNSQQDGIVTPGDYSGDWDGTWYSQTSSEGDYWYSEIHIPWTVAPMNNAGQGRKKMALWFSRVVFNESLRFAYPNAYYSRTTFLEDWHRVEVDQVSASTLDWFPYVSYGSDLQNNAGTEAEQFNVGLDFVWRPNSSTQLTGALKPDFGQVESDDLVVNFSAFETYVSEKRPFFTENQSLFDASVPNGDSMLYTRRMGSGPSGSNGGLVDIDIAGKLTHFGENTDLGLFVVSEDQANQSVGGDFLSSRIRHKKGGLTLGHRLTYAERGLLGRDSTVQSLDMKWQKNPQVQILGQLLHSDVQQQGNSYNEQQDINSQDYAGWAKWSYAPSDNWSQSVYASRYGDQFDMNDMGFMKRNGYSELLGRTRHDRLNYGDDSDILSGFSLLEYGYTENTDGKKLFLWAMYHQDWIFKSTRSLHLDAGLSGDTWDDRITRGNGLYAKDAAYWLEGKYGSPRGDSFSYRANIYTQFGGADKRTLSVSFKPQYYLSERVTLAGQLSYKNVEAWLIWDFDQQQLARYQTERYGADLRFDWYPSNRQEVRLKFQWVGIDAQVISGYGLNNNGGLVESSQASSNFSLSDTALQVRYRYQLAPLSDIFLVYSRGGNFGDDDGDEGPRSLLQDGWSRVQVESVIAKLRYRF